MAVLVVVAIGFTGCNSGSDYPRQFMNYTRFVGDREDHHVGFYFPHTNQIFNINDYGNDGVLDEISMTRNGVIERIYVNCDTKDKYPRVKRYREQWHEDKIREVSQEYLDSQKKGIIHRADLINTLR